MARSLSQDEGGEWERQRLALAQTGKRAGQARPAPGRATSTTCPLKPWASLCGRLSSSLRVLPPPFLSQLLVLPLGASARAQLPAEGQQLPLASPFSHILLFSSPGTLGSSCPLNPKPQGLRDLSPHSPKPRTHPGGELGGDRSRAQAGLRLSHGGGLARTRLWAWPERGPVGPRAREPKTWAETQMLRVRPGTAWHNGHT